MMNCRTLGKATEKYCKYEKIVDETAITDVKREGGFAILSNVTIDNVLAGIRQFSDFKIYESIPDILKSENCLLPANTLSIVTLLSIAKPPSLLTSVMAVSSTIFSYLQYFSAASPRVRQFIIIYPEYLKNLLTKALPGKDQCFH